MFPDDAASLTIRSRLGPEGLAYAEVRPQAWREAPDIVVCDDDDEVSGLRVGMETVVAPAAFDPTRATGCADVNHVCAECCSSTRSPPIAMRQPPCSIRLIRPCSRRPAVEDTEQS